MSLLEQKANEVAGHIKDSDESEAICFDPMTILTIISIIVGLIGIWQRCNTTPVIAVESMKEDSALNNRQIRKVVRIESQRHPAGERKEFREKMAAAVLKMGRNLTVADMEKLFEEAAKQAA